MLKLRHLDQLLFQSSNFIEMNCCYQSHDIFLWYFFVCFNIQYVFFLCPVGNETWVWDLKINLWLIYQDRIYLKNPSSLIFFSFHLHQTVIPRLKYKSIKPIKNTSYKVMVIWAFARRVHDPLWVILKFSIYSLLI